MVPSSSLPWALAGYQSTPDGVSRPTAKQRYNHAVKFTTVFFDLDDTLYPSSTGLWEAIKERMNVYMRDRMGFDPAEIPQVREKYYLQYGTTLRGLQAHHEIDVQDFLAFVHDLPLADFILPNPDLCTIISALGTRNFIFTNADAAHARGCCTCSAWTSASRTSWT